VPGPADNPLILGWAREAGVADVYRHDEVAWCGLFMAVVARRSGKIVPHDPLWALNWRTFGVQSERAALGDVLVMTRAGGGGHVCLYVGEDDEAYHGLGGNTRDCVSIARFDRHRIVAVRRPLYHHQPAGVRPYLLERTGAISTDES
jgi:uncharacterized protein (TIGR02594 family)